MRKRILLLLLCSLFMECISCQETLMLPHNATSLTEEQKGMNPDRLAYPKSMKAKIEEEVSFECEPETGDLGPFSVSPTTKVMFSPGNLQYNAAKGTHACADGTTQQGTWRFAEHQWDYVGDETYGTVYENGVKSSNTLISSTYNGWIDLFGWGTSGWNNGIIAYQPYATSTSYTDYLPGESPDTDLTGTYAYADWGVYNAIYNGSATDPPSTWRTLTQSEWEYLFFYRPIAEKLFGFGTVNGVPGVIILPDDWVMLSGITFTPSIDKGLLWTGTKYENSQNDNYTHNNYNLTEWKKLESAGAVFLPAAGHRFEYSSSFVANLGVYFSSTALGGAHNFDTMFDKSQLTYVVGNCGRSCGKCVRLVRDNQ